MLASKLQERASLLIVFDPSLCIPLKARHEIHLMDLMRLLENGPLQ